MNVLIAFDGSAHSEAAIVELRLAGLPQRTRAVVLSVLDGREPDESKSDPRASEAWNQQLEVAERGAAMLRELFPGWTVSAEVRVGSPAWEIIKRAEGDGAAAGDAPFDLVVVGSRGMGEIRRLLLGSVAHRVVTSLKGSVRVSRRKGDSTQPSSGITMPPRIVVGVDGSTDARAALEAIASRQWPVGTQVVAAAFETGPVALASQWEPETIWGGTPASLGLPGAAARPAQQAVAEAAEFLRSRCPQLTVTTLVKPADPKYGLIGAAESWDADGADCIFVGATGVRGIDRFLLGSVSTTVAMSATCSVEIVRRRM